MNAAPPSSRRRPPGLWALLAAGVIGGITVTAWGVARSSWALGAASATFTGALLWAVSNSYKRWVRSLSGSWRWREEIGTGLGLVAIAGGALLLRLSSDHDSPGLAAAGTSLAVVGFIPVAHAIHKDLAKQRGAATVATAQLANATVAAAAVIPAFVIVQSHWWLGAVIASIWWTSAGLDRVSRSPLYPWVAAVASVVAVLLAILVGLVPPKSAGSGTTGPGIVVLAIIAALLGLFDAVSAWVRNRTAPAGRIGGRRGLRVAATGIGVMSAAGGATLMILRLGGTPLPTKALVIGALVVFGAAFITRAQGFVATVLIASLAVWTVHDRNDRAPVDPNPTASTRIVAIGDSYISGEGAKRFFPGTNISGGNDCRRSSSSYAYLLAVRFHMSLQFLACSGASAREVWLDPQIQPDSKPGDPIGKKPQLDNVDPTAPPPALVLVTIGGNDAFFGDVGKGCALPGSCSELQSLFLGNLPAVRSQVAEALVKVAHRFPSSPIVSVPYPLMVPPEGCNHAPLDAQEFEFLNHFVSALDTGIQDAVDDANGTLGSARITYFADGVNAYSNHGAQLCHKSGKDALHVLAFAPTEAPKLAQRLFPTNWLHNSFHPTAYGHTLVADELGSWLAGRYAGFPGTATATTTAPPDTSLIGLTPQCDPAVNCSGIVHQWMVEQAIGALQHILPAIYLLILAGWILAALQHI